MIHSDPRPLAARLFIADSFGAMMGDARRGVLAASWAKGDGRTASVMVFSQSRGFVPVIKTFTADREWERFHFGWKDFDGLDGTQTLGIFWGGGSEPGPFELLLDDVRLEPLSSLTRPPSVHPGLDERGR
jgi:hypothetical protein